MRKCIEITKTGTREGGRVDRKNEHLPRISTRETEGRLEACRELDTMLRFMK